MLYVCINLHTECGKNTPSTSRLTILQSVPVVLITITMEPVCNHLVLSCSRCKSYYPLCIPPISDEDHDKFEIMIIIVRGSYGHRVIEVMKRATNRPVRVDGPRTLISVRLGICVANTFRLTGVLKLIVGSSDLMLQNNCTLPFRAPEMGGKHALCMGLLVNCKN